MTDLQGKVGRETVPQIFRGMGRNFVTPDIEGYGRGTLADGTEVAYEVSSGRGIFDPSQILYGVTFLLRIDGEWVQDWRDDRDLSRMFYSYPEVRAYLAEVVR